EYQYNSCFLKKETRAHHLAHGAALKWASGMFCQPAHLEHLGQYKKRESQRTAFIHTRLKVIRIYTSTGLHQRLK
uniref:Uncharacterized protein n=1 Tax=Periophthalmus magnuspinnatus TaxID=409849 RepID=A0A3B3ZMB2_9GOBI